MSVQSHPAANSLAIAVSSAVLSLAVVGESHAQTTMLEEVVVTAQKRPETTQETPISITAFSETTIEKRGIANSADLIGEVPGVGGFSAPGSRGTSGLSMRGVSAGSPANLSLDPAVALYLDGVYVGKLVGSSMDVAEIERIEVLRGPQGTLYGRNSTGGAVNFIAKKPSGEFGVRATATVGDYDLWGVKANLDLPAVGEVGQGLGEFAANIGLQTRQRDALYDNFDSSQSGFDELDREAVRFALQWMPSEAFTADYVYDYNKLDEAGALQQVVGFTPLDAAGNVSRVAALQGTLQQAQALAAIPGTDPRISSRWIPSLQESIGAYQAAAARGPGRQDNGGSDFAPTAENEVDGHALTLTWDAGDLGALGDVVFKSITAYRDLETYVFGDLEDIDSRLDSNGVGAMTDLVHLTLGQLYGPSSGFSYPLVDGLWDSIDGIGAYHSKQDTTTRYEQFSQELHMVGTTDRTDYVLGLYYFEDEGEYRRNAIFAAPLNGMGSQNYDNTTDALAVFGQSTWRPRWQEERLSVTLGLRYTEERKEIDYAYSEVVTPFGVTPARATSRENNFYNLSGNATIAYQLSDEVNTFLRYATGYRSGGFNGEIFDNAYDEETVEQWEIGVKSDWWDNRLRINGSLYTYTWEDIQASQIKTDGGAATSLITNAGEADRWGGELEVSVVPTDDLILSLSYAYINGDFEEFPEHCGSNVPQTCLDTDNLARRGASPGNQLNFSADYVLARTSFGEFTGYLQVNWQDDWAETALWTAVVGGEPVIYDHLIMDQRTIVNARVSLEDVAIGDGTMRVSLWGKNLTDDDYPTFGINFGSLGPLAEQYGEPLTWGVDFTYDY